MSRGPYLIRDRLFLRFYSVPRGEVHGTWQPDSDRALEFDKRDAAEAKAATIKRNMARADRWRIEVVPQAEAARTPSLFRGATA